MIVNVYFFWCQGPYEWIHQNSKRSIRKIFVVLLLLSYLVYCSRDLCSHGLPLVSHELFRTCSQAIYVTWGSSIAIASKPHSLK